MTTDNEYEDLAMRVYWDCQELQGRLTEVEADGRRAVILSWLETQDGKYPVIPDFKPEYSWYNLSSRLTLENLNGCLTLIDFFTYCCINCLHILPDLARLEEKYKGKLTVVGVHSAKFDNEKVGDHVKKAVARYDIRHPVCNDTAGHLWSTLGVTCWPTQLLLCPRGRPVAVAMGEGHAGLVEELVQAMLEFYGERGSLTSPGVVGEGGGEVEGRMLRYPGKLAVTEEMMVISDTGHHRLLITDRAGAVLDIVGGEEAGDAEGGYQETRLRSPQGLCVAGSRVWLCDTDNHKMKCVDLQTKTVSSLTAEGVSSPWDCCHLSSPDRGEAVLVAMAGSHQVWLLAVSDVTWWKGVKYPAGSFVSVVGSGAEENRNNSYPHKAGLAQPSGICSDQEFLYVADSESSTVRRISLKDGAVTNLAGGERDPTNLFAYGDTDGAGVAAKLQHPLGVSVDSSGRVLYIADSYNHKIKTAVLQGKLYSVSTIMSGLSEPGGLCYVQDNNSVYIADTNSHSIKVLELASGHLRPLPITADVTDSPDKVRRSDHQLSCEAGQVRLRAGLGLQPGRKLNTEAPSVWRLSCSDKTWQVTARGEITEAGLATVLSHPALVAATTTTVEISARLYVCTEEGLCLVQSSKHLLSLTAVAQADNSTTEIDLGLL